MDNVVDVAPKHRFTYKAKYTKYLTDKQFKIVESAKKNKKSLTIYIAKYFGDKDNKKATDDASYTGTPNDILKVWFQMCDNTAIHLAIGEGSYAIKIDEHKFHFLVLERQSGKKLFEYRMDVSKEKKKGVL